jgi:hypothetical protein
MESAGYAGKIIGKTGLTVCSVMAWEAGNGVSEIYYNYCSSSYIPDDSILGKRYTFKEKFPEPCITINNPAHTENPITYQGVENVLSYFGSTRVSNNIYSFVESSQVGMENGLWTQTNASSNPLRMILPSGSFAHTAAPFGHDPIPRPGTIFARVIWTYRTFASPTFQNSFRDDVEDTQGPKSWTLKIGGKYYT